MTLVGAILFSRVLYIDTYSLVLCMPERNIQGHITYHWLINESGARVIANPHRIIGWMPYILTLVSSEMGETLALKSTHWSSVSMFIYHGWI